MSVCVVEEEKEAYTLQAAHTQRDIRSLMAKVQTRVQSNLSFSIHLLQTAAYIF